MKKKILLKFFSIILQNYYIVWLLCNDETEEKKKKTSQWNLYQCIYFSLSLSGVRTFVDRICFIFFFFSLRASPFTCKSTNWRACHTLCKCSIQSKWITANKQPYLRIFYVDFELFSFWKRKSVNTWNRLIGFSCISPCKWITMFNSFFFIFIHSLLLL